MNAAESQNCCQRCERGEMAARERDRMQDEAFGFDRCMWGTDWTRAVGLLTYQQGVEAFRVTDRLSEADRAKLTGETLSRIYDWPKAHA